MMLVLNEVSYQFTKDMEAKAYAKSGDVITFITQNAMGDQFNTENDVFSNTKHENLNAATGPLYVEGAEKGDVLAVDILDIRVDELGVTTVVPEEGAIWDQCEERTRIFKVKDNRVTWENHDVSWNVNPMIGVIGCAHDDIL